MIGASAARRHSSQWGHADANSFDECFLVALHSAPLPHYHAPPPPPPHTVSAFSQPVCRIGILYVCMCVCLCTHGREYVFSVLLHGRLSMCIDFAACHLHVAVRLLCAASLLAVLDMKHVKMKGSQLKTVVSRTISLITA